jgi:hypothetical protein
VRAATAYRKKGARLRRRPLQRLPRGRSGSEGDRIQDTGAANLSGPPQKAVPTKAKPTAKEKNNKNETNGKNNTKNKRHGKNKQHGKNNSKNKQRQQTKKAAKDCY